jgi:hypothetical protein
VNHQHMRQLAARFIAEAEAAINDALAAGVDPHHEYAVLVGRLHNERPSRPRLPSEPNGIDCVSGPAGYESNKPEHLALSELSGL